MNIANVVTERHSHEWIIEDNERGIFSLRAKAYTDSDLYKQELALVFDKSWLYAAHESELPNNGDFLTRNVGGREILIVRGKDGVIRTFLNACRHKGAPVCRERKGNTSKFQCIYHAWTYSNQGALIGVPLKEAYGPNFKTSDSNLFDIRMDDYRGLLFICYDKSAVSLREFLGPAVDPLDLFLDQHGRMTILPGSHQYRMSANWKMLVENSMDAYHALSVHNRFFYDYMPNVLGSQMNREELFNAKAEYSGVRDLGNGHSVFEVRKFTKNIDTNKRATWESQYGVERTKRLLDYSRNVFLYPNTLISEQFPMIRTHFPLSADVTESTAWSLVPAEEDLKLREGRIRQFLSFLGPGGFGTPDDIEIMEQSQKNCHAMPDDAYLNVSRGMLREKAQPDDELSNRLILREWRRQLSARSEGAGCMDGHAAN